MDLDLKPPPDTSIIKRIIKAGGRRLPGMVPASFVPESDQQCEEELTLQVIQADGFLLDIHMYIYYFDTHSQ